MFTPCTPAQFEADSNATLVDSFSVLVNSLYNHASDLKDVSQLKSSPDGCVDQAELIGLEQRIRVVEHTFKALRRHLAEEADAIAGVKNLHNVVQEHAGQIQKICSHLPEHLPQQGAAAFASLNVGGTAHQAAAHKQQQWSGTVPAAAKENIQSQAEAVSISAGGTHKAKTGRKARKPAAKCTGRIQRLRYLTVDEFSAVPTYTRGRLSLNKVNSAINELHTVVLQKYELFDKNPRKLGSRQQDVLMMYKEQETPETEGRFFVTERELRKAATCTMKNDTGRAIIQTLRHCKRLQSVTDGGLTRYVLIEA